MTLYTLTAFASLNHAMRTGSNVTILLTALSLQASPVVVGLLVAFSSLMPMLFAVSIGRLNDRIGARWPMAVGSGISAVSLLLPALWPGLPALFIATTLAGLGTACFSVPAQNTAGQLGRPEDRTRNFSFLSISFSAGGVAGPMIAGPVIDLFGHSAAFMLLAALPVPAAIAIAAGWVKLPPPRGAAAREGQSRKNIVDLVRNPRMRTIYLITALHVSAWEVFAFLVPIYGNQVGLAATSIALVLSSFSAATFLVRIIMPLFARRFRAMTLIRGSLVLAGLLFILFPLTSSVPLLMGLAFILGIGMGVTQPLAMSVLHEAAPPGRTGEAVGLRTSVVNLSAATTPVIYGALGSALGMTPVFWGLAVALWIALWALR